MTVDSWRHRAARIPAMLVGVWVDIILEDDCVYEGKILDITLAGAQVVSPAPVESGDCISIRIRNTDICMMTPATVTWLNDDHFGCSFEQRLGPRELGHLLATS